MAQIEVPTRLLPPSEEEASNFCRSLEQGNILFFRDWPFEFPAKDIDFLLEQRQSDASYRKNIAYRPLEDRVTGVAGTKDAAEQLRRILGNYSRSVTSFLEELLTPYADSWKLDYASFRPIQEKGREVKEKRRNDLLHVDAFPTRPTGGNRILRFFTNINPDEERHWVVGKPFADSINQWASAGFPVPGAEEPFLKSLERKTKAIANRCGLPIANHSRYDSAMLELHDFLKSDRAYQENCEKEHLHFPPGSCWIVFTDLVPHAALSGRFALEQTFIINRHSLLLPEKSPLAVLESLAGCELV